MKEFTVKLGGENRRLRYTPLDAVQLYKEFPKPPEQLVREDVLGGFDEEGNPRSQFHPPAQMRFLHLGLANDLPRLTERQLSEWLEKHLEEGGTIYELVWTAAKAAYYSGVVVGYKVDLEERIRTKREAEGKGEAAPSSPPPTIPAAE